MSRRKWQFLSWVAIDVSLSFNILAFFYKKNCSKLYRVNQGEQNHLVVIIIQFVEWCVGVANIDDGSIVGRMVVFHSDFSLRNNIGNWYTMI